MDEKIRENFWFYGGMSFLYGILFTCCMYQNPNGITFPVFVLITIVFAIQYVKKLGLRVKKDTWLYAVGMILLGISSCVTSNGFIIFFNLAGILLLFVVMMIHQFYQDKEWNFQTYFKNLFILFGTSVSCIPYLFKHTSKNIVGKSTKKKKTVVYILIGMGIAFLLLLIIFPLLIRSDRVFEMYFSNFIHYIRLGNFFWMFVMTMTMAVICYAFFGGVCRDNLKRNSEEQKNIWNPVVGITFTSILAFIYIVYCSIQVVYLFIGIENGLPEGITYSAYARSGFWELLFVSIINFVMILLCVYLFEENRILKGILTIISLCTFIMIFSSAYRMCMYVGAYHLTFLRVLVLWFLFLLTLIMGGTIFSIYRKCFPLFRYIMFVTACCYIAFSLAKPDYWIAKYNVEHMKSIKWEDANYFIYSLSDDAAPIIAELDFQKKMDYDDGIDEVLYNYFNEIKIKYENKDIRKFNYSHFKALKSAEKYLEKK